MKRICKGIVKARCGVVFIDYPAWCEGNEWSPEQYMSANIVKLTVDALRLGYPDCIIVGVELPKPVA